MTEPPVTSYFKRVEALFEEACDLNADQRSEFLDEACAGNDKLRSELEELLNHDDLMHEESADGEDAELAAEARLPMPVRIGSYNILRECGHGGMGTVYEAEQDTPRRRVALKLIRRDSISPGTLKRFRREAEILGRLQHPGIAHIHEAGTYDAGYGPQPFIAMEFVDGKPLNLFAENEKLTVEERLLLFARICDAVQHAHLKGVLHRDLKPDNVLVSRPSTTLDTDTPRSRHESGTANGEETAQVGNPKILDFGVARLTDADTDLTTMQTAAGQVIGTMQYMSPEQALGDTDDLDTRSDIYALGVMLFELLSGRPPYDLSSRGIPDAVLAIRSQEPTKLSALGVAWPSDIETIVGKALEKNRDRRYQSAAEFAADLRRYLRNEPIAARPPSTWYQARKFAERNRALVGGGLATFAVTLIGAVVATMFGLRSAENAVRANLEAYRAALVAAGATVNASPRIATGYLDQTPEGLRGWEWRHLKSLTRRHTLSYRCPSPTTGPLAFTADGDFMVGALEGGLVGVWPSGASNPVRILEFGAEISSLSLPAFGPPRLAIGLQQNGAVICDLEGGDRVPIQAGLEGSVCVSWDAQGDRLALSDSKAGFVWDSTLGLRVVYGEATYPGAIAMHPSGTRVAMIGSGKFRTVVLIECDTRAVLGNAVLGENPMSLAFSADGATLLVGTQHRMVAELSAASLDFERWLLGHEQYVDSIACAQSGGLVASSGSDGSVRFWRDGSEKSVLYVGHSATLAFHPGGASVAFMTGGAIRLWDLTGGSEVVLRGHSSYVYEVRYSPDGSLLASSTRYAPEVKLWNPSRGSLLGSIEPHVGVWHFGFTEEGDLEIDRWRYPIRFKAGTSRFDSSRVEDPELLTLPELLRCRRISSFDVWSRDRTRQVRNLDAEEPELTVFDSQGDVLGRVSPPLSRYFGADLSPDGRYLAAASESGVVDIWDLNSFEIVQVLTEHQASGAVYCVAFHPTEPRLASGGNDGIIRLWDTHSWEQVYELRGHGSYVKSLDFHPDGSQLASGSGDFTVRLWDTLSRAERARR